MKFTLETYRKAKYACAMSPDEVKAMNAERWD